MEDEDDPPPRYLRVLEIYEPPEAENGYMQQELAIYPGDNLMLVEQVAPPGWLQVRLDDGTEGLVPEAYVEEVIEGEEPAAIDEAAAAGDAVAEPGPSTSEAMDAKSAPVELQMEDAVWMLIENFHPQVSLRAHACLNSRACASVRVRDAS